MDLVLILLIHMIVFLSRFSELLAKIGVGSFSRWTPGRPMELLLVGYNGARNTGADARVAAIVKQLKQLFGAEAVHITVMTLDEKNLEGYFDEDVTLLPFSSIFLWDLYRACCRSHAAILCEGSTLKSTFADALTLFFCEAAGIMARQKKPCIAYGSEVGDMTPQLRRTAVRLCRETYFITRTGESQAALDALDLTGHIGTDTAWSYDGAVPDYMAEAILKQSGWDGAVPLLGVAVINPFLWPVHASFLRWVKGLCTGKWDGQYDKWYFFSDSPARQKAFEEYISQLAEAVSRFCDAHGCFPVLIGMERLDADACQALAQRLGRPCAIVRSGDYSAGYMTGVLRRFSILVTSRYHAAVLSMGASIPIIAVSMDERLDSLFRELSFEKDYLHSVSEPQLGEHLYRSMEKAWQARSDIAAQIQSHYTHYMERLSDMGSFLKTYISGRLS